MWRRHRKEQPPTNYRETHRKQERTLLFLVIVVLVGVGTGLIGLIWGVQAGLTGGVCLLGGAILIGGMWLLLILIERLVGE